MDVQEMNNGVIDSPALFSFLRLSIMVVSQKYLAVFSLLTCLLLNCESLRYVYDAQGLIYLFNESEGNTVSDNITVCGDLVFNTTDLYQPLGMSDGKCAISFSGTLQGNNFLVKNLLMGVSGEYAGLFCKLENATIENLVIDSSCGFRGKYSGALGAILTGSLEVKNVTNKANVSGLNGGGFIGFAEGIVQGNVSFDRCVNEGVVRDEKTAGGFIGSISDCSGTSVIISNSINNGNVISNFHAGGFVGTLDNSNSQRLLVTNATNNGNVSGPDGFGIIAGGFVGAIVLDNIENSISVEVINSVNNGKVSKGNKMNCGFLCVSKNNGINSVNITVVNSINKGNVADSSSYGITNVITKARNVVCVGDISGSSDSHTFWDDGKDLDLFYGLKDKCKGCEKAIIFEYNTSTGFYVLENGEYVQDLLNMETLKQKYGMVWTRELELVGNLTLEVKVNGLVQSEYSCKLGDQLGTVGDLLNYFNNEEIGVVDAKSEERVIYNSSDIVSRNMSVVLGKWVNVSVGIPINKMGRVFAGDTLEQVARFFQFSLDNYIFIVIGTGDVLNRSSVIEGDVVLTVYHKVSVSGALNRSWILEHGKKLGDVQELLPFFESSYVIYDSQNNVIVYKKETLVDKNISAVIVIVDIQDIVIVIDDEYGPADINDITKAIANVITSISNSNIWIGVVSQGDGSYIITVKQSDDNRFDVARELKKCLNHNP